MTYTSRLFDAHKTVIEGFIIEQDGLDAYKNLKYAPKLSEAKIKYAMLERMLEIIAGGLDVNAVEDVVRADKEKQARAFLEAQQQNHVEPEVIEERESQFADAVNAGVDVDDADLADIASHLEDNLFDNADVEDEVPNLALV